MRREIFHYGEPGAKYGIWNTLRKEWQFGICENTPMLAEARLFSKIGTDAYKWRFEARRLPKSMIPQKNPSDEMLWTQLLKHRGHNVSIVSYGGTDNPADVCLECEDCGEVILDAELYTLRSRKNR